MKNNLKILFNIFAFIILTISGNVVFASAASVTFQVTATVLPFCTVTASALGFGNYTSNNNTDQTSIITVNCTSGTGYHVKLDQGLHGTSTTARKMQGVASASNLLNYALYSDSARTVNWGNQTADSVSGTGTGAGQNYTVYGRIASGQTTAPADTYIDTIGVSITIP